jgi:hypothetical protein
VLLKKEVFMGTKSVGEVINESMNFSRRKINNDSMTNGKPARAAYTEYVADRLVSIFNAPKSRNFFLKCAWHLSEDTIWSAVEDTKKKGVKSPVKLFVFLCNNALREAPVKV